MKKILLLISLLSFMGCGEFSPRKDLSSNIIFTSSIPQGKYNFNLISFKYPNSYLEKIEFYKELNQGLSSMNSADLSMINLLIPSNMEEDLNHIINKGWLDQEILAMKNAGDLTKEDIANLDSLDIKTPTDSGNIQKYLNEQYFLLLKLTKNENLYLPNYSYTELDKITIMEKTLLKRNSLRENLKKIQHNFVYTELNSDLHLKNAIYATKNYFQYTNPVVFTPSNEFSGFKVNKDNLVLFTGNGETLLDTKNYEFISQIIKLNSPLEIKSIIRKNNSSPVSEILSWTRKESNKRTKNISMEESFSKWED